MGQKLEKMRSGSPTSAVRMGRRRSVSDDERVLIEGNALSCPVCYNVFHKSPATLPCGHSLCRQCLAHIAKVSPAADPAGRPLFLCPLCRKKSPLDHFPDNFALKTVLDSIRQLTDENLPILDRNLKFENVRLRKELAESELCQRDLKQRIEMEAKRAGNWRTVALLLLGFIVASYLYRSDHLKVYT